MAEQQDSNDLQKITQNKVAGKAMQHVPLSQRELPPDLLHHSPNEPSSSGDNICDNVSAEFVMSRLNKLDASWSNRLVLFSCDNAELFFISPDGEVTSDSEPRRLHISKISNDLTEDIFLEVGTWIYPLLPSASPCFRTEKGLFIFPDLYSQIKGATVGLRLPELESLTLHELLNDILNGDDDSRVRRDTSISDKIQKGATYLAKNLVRTSEGAARYMNSLTSDKIKTEYDAYVEPSPVHFAAQFSGKVAGASRYLSNNVSNAVAALGSYISPYLRNMLPEGAVPTSAVNVASTLLYSAGTIYSGLEESGAILANSLSNNAVKVVNKRYGPSSAQLTKDVLTTIGNIYSTQRNLKLLKPKTLARATIRSAGTAILEDLQKPKTDVTVNSERLQLL